MKKISLFMMLVIAVSLLLITTQAFASPAAVTAAKPTGGPPAGTMNAPGLHVSPSETMGPPPVTPGAQATAQVGLHGKPQVFRGTITAVDSSSLTLALADGSSVTIGITGDTRIRVPGPQSAGDTLLVGMQAVVMAFTDQNNNLVARAIMAIPGQPVRAHRVGTVTAYSPGSSITIQASDGNSYTFNLGANTKILPAELAGQLVVGSRVTIIAPRVPSSLGWTAIGIVVHPAGS